jgi:uncharacterized membrane protein
MAGIGLRLNQLVTQGSRQAAVAYTAAGVYSGGPWLSTVLAIALLAGASVAFLTSGDRSLLFASIAYPFAASLVVTGGMQMILSRFLADRLYLEDHGALAPTCGGVLLNAIPLLILVAPFIVLAPLDITIRLLVSASFITLSLTWLVMPFLSAGRYYGRIVLAFTLGGALGVSAAIWLGHAFGTAGALYGFALGQVITLWILIAAVYLEFPSAARSSFAYLGYLRKYWDLVLVGLLYMGGIWLDNAVYWLSSQGLEVAHFYRISPPYDTSKLLAYLFTIPASAVFLVHVEARFYGRYREFFRLVTGKGTLTGIGEARRQMVAAIGSGLKTLLIVQVVVVLGALLLAPELVRALHVPGGRPLLLRVELLAASGQFLLLAAVLLLLYFDQRRVALAVVTLFALGNTGLSVLTLRLGSDFDGAGYMVATIMTSLVALLLLRRRLGSLEYRTFMLQPVASGSD